MSQALLCCLILLLSLSLLSGLLFDITPGDQRVRMFCSLQALNSLLT